MTQIIKPILDLLGAFTLLTILLFDSSAVGRFITGGAGFSSPVLAISGAILAMAITETIFLFLQHNFPSIARYTTAGISVLFPLIALVLIVNIATINQTNQTIPLITIFLLCIAAISQIHCFTRTTALDARRMFLASGISLAIAILFLYLVFSMMNSAIAGFTLLTFIMSVTGALPLISILGSSRDQIDESDIPIESKSDKVSETTQKKPLLEMESSNQHVGEMVMLALPLVIVSFFCTFALGQSQQERLFSVFDDHFIPLMLILCVFIAFGLLIFHAWKKMNIDAFLVGLALPLTLPILATLFEHLAPNLFIAALLMLTQILYLLFSWTSVLLIGRMISAGNSLTPGFFVLFLMFYAVFISIPQLENIAVTSRMITLASIGLLISLLLYFAHKANVDLQNIENKTPEMGYALQQKCDEAAALYGLSPRESELLPMLAIGLSASVIGNRVVLSNHTIKTHRYRIYQKIGISSHEELVEKLGLVTPTDRL